MPRQILAICLLALVTVAPLPAASLHDSFSGPQCFAYTAEVAGFGERWPGSPGHQKTEDLIHQVLEKDGAQVEADNFTANTPRGPVPVHNIIGKFNVTDDPKQPIFILAGHYDTLFKKGFIGANDGASSTAMILSFADALAHQKTKMQIWLVWTDLEEAIQQFSNGDGLYGSTHLAQKITAEGLVPRVVGFFLLDMIGDKDLAVARETNSSAELQRVIAEAAGELGYGSYFFRYDADIIDDHAPFIEAGIPAVDVVDAEFGPNSPGSDGMGAYHHTNLDTMDKVSEHSLEVVGRTIMLTIELIDARI
jgi:glutaminyl-peptide cyclotransferase